MGTPGAFLGSMVFGGLGFVCMAYGKSMGQAKTMLLGGLMTGFTFFVSDAWAIWGIGLGLCALLYFWRDR